jgi:hypothetical protein
MGVSLVVWSNCPEFRKASIQGFNQSPTGLEIAWESVRTIE